METRPEARVGETSGEISWYDLRAGKRGSDAGAFAFSPVTEATGHRRILEAGAEHALWHRWREHHDIAAADQLAAAHRWLVNAIAAGYRGLGVAAEELLGDGFVGLMYAVCRYDPDCHVSFASFAIPLIRGTIHESVMRTWVFTKMEAVNSPMASASACGVYPIAAGPDGGNHHE